MTYREKVIDDLNAAKLILCNPQMLAPEMCIRVGQAITSAINLLKEQKPPKEDYNAESILTNQRCPKCGSNAVDIHAYKRVGLPWFLCRLCGTSWDWNSPPKEG